MKLEKRYTAALILLVTLMFMFLPWLGLTPFNTKGEPREAIVAVSMLQSGNWILPVSFGCEIPYKPPFLAWCVALFSIPQGCVSEFTSRLPSAIAAICLAMMTFRFIRRRLGSVDEALLSVGVLVTSMEVWRAASVCRVDMVLTAFIAGAVFGLYTYRERGYKGFPWGAWICMTCAVLTKGPVGAFLPCLVAGVFGLLRGDRFRPLFGRLAGVAVLSLVLPALWYYAAYRQGGKEFLDLVIEENFGRFTGTMSYSSHEKGLWYNFVTVALGMLPYTVVGLFALAVVKWRQINPRGWVARFWRWLRNADSATVFTVVATLVIFVFYCIPKSKRSVYLLPIYPFMAYYVALLFKWLAERKPMLVKAYALLIGILTFAVGLLTLLTPYLPVGYGIGWVGHVIAFAAVAMSVYLGWMLWMRRAAACARLSVVATMFALTALSAGILPEVGKEKCQKAIAEEIEKTVGDATVYSYMSSPMARFYEMNYYMDDRLRVYDHDLPEEGLLLLADSDIEEWRRIYGEIYVMEPIANYEVGAGRHKGGISLMRISPTGEQVGNDERGATDKNEI